MSELRECPLCQSKAEKRTRFDIRCTECGLELNGQPHLVEEAWNTRPQDEAVQAVVEAAKEMTASLAEGFMTCNSSIMGGTFIEIRCKDIAATQLLHQRLIETTVAIKALEATK